MPDKKTGPGRPSSSDPLDHAVQIRLDALGEQRLARLCERRSRIAGVKVSGPAALRWLLERDALANEEKATKQA